MAVGLALLLGCHSAPKPSTPSAAKIESDPKLAGDYKWARLHQITDATKACDTFKSLASNAQFPLPQLAQLRAVETCTAELAPAFERKTLPVWMQDQAIDVLLKLPATQADKSTELELAVEKSKQKLPQGEKITWMNVAIQNAEGLKRDDLDLKTRLYMIAPRLNPSPIEKQYLSVANDLRSARLFSAAREFYEKVLASKNYGVEDKIRALKGMRMAYKNARDNDAHIRASNRLIKFLRAQTKGKGRASKRMLTALFDAQIYHARAMWTLGHPQDAKDIFAKLEKAMKGQVSRAELFWLQSRMLEESGERDHAADYLERALKEPITDPDFHDKVLWYSAWNERGRGNLPRAIEILNSIDQTTLQEFTRQRALFWLGKSYVANHQEEDGKKTFLRLIDIDPLGYYGLLAHRQLNTPITLNISPPPVEAQKPDAVLPFDRTIAEWLGNLGESEILSAYLDEAAQNYRKLAEQSDDTWVTIFKGYAKAGLYMKLFERLGNLTPEQRRDILEHHTELLFPQPWGDDVRAAALQFGIGEDLIYSIIRQESAFDPHARSLADAFGLMQLLPEVAQQMGAKYKIPYTAMDDLYDPKTNITCGAAHLKELFERYHGQFILAVASYNASESVLRNWMKTRFHGDALEFIEEIPYEEARAYVRLVMRNVIFYDLLKTKDASLEFPGWVLKLEGV